MTEDVRQVFFWLTASVLVCPVLYVAFRMASAGWHRSKVEIERLYKQGERDGK